MGTRRNKMIAYQGTEGLTAPKRQEHLWRAIYRETARHKQGSRCLYCLEPISKSKATADHKEPKIRGGQTAPRNIAAACQPCNRTKSAMSELAFKKAIRHPQDQHKIDIWLAHSRRRIWLRTQQAEHRILRFAGMKVD